MADITKYTPHCYKLAEVAKSVTSHGLRSLHNITPYTYIHTTFKKKNKANFAIY